MPCDPQTTPSILEAREADAFACIAGYLTPTERRELWHAQPGKFLSSVSETLSRLEPPVVVSLPGGWRLTQFGCALRVGLAGLVLSAPAPAPKTDRPPRGRPPRGEWLPDWDRQMQEEWRPPHAVSQRAFSRRFGVHVVRVQRAAQRLRLLPDSTTIGERSKSLGDYERAKRCARSYRHEGLSYAKIGRREGISGERVRQIVQFFEEASGV